MRFLLPILLAIIASEQLANGYRILGIFPMNGKSHWLSGERLMLGLAKKGHQVDVISHFPQKKPVPNYTDISVAGSIPEVVNNVNATDVSRIRKQDFQYMLNKLGHETCNLMGHPKVQQLIKNPPKDPPYDLVIIEVFMAPCYLALGKHLNVPMVTIMTTTFFDWMSYEIGNPYKPSFVPGLFTSYGSQMTFTERLMNTVLTSLVYSKIQYYMGYQSEYVKKHLGMDISIRDTYKDISLTLVNSHHSLNGARPLSTGVIEVGGLHVSDDLTQLPPDVQKWLDESTHGCVLFTFGSMVRIESFPRPLLDALYKSFENIAPVRVLMKIAHKADLPPGLPKNVMIQPWFPQVAVFKHKNLKAFITHGGLLSNQEAIYFGIPMIGIPLFGDQSVNMKNAANKKIAVNLNSIENVTEESLTNAIKAVVYDESYRNNAKKLAKVFKDRPMTALDTAIYWSEYVARHGNVLQSPAIHLTWWQQDLLDIYAVLIAGVLAVLYIVLLGLRKLKNWLTGCKTCSKKDKKSESKKKK